MSTEARNLYQNIKGRTKDCKQLTHQNLRCVNKAKLAQKTASNKIV